MPKSIYKNFEKLLYQISLSFMKHILLSMPSVVFILYHYSPKQFDTSISLVLKPQNEVAFKFKRDLDKRKYMSFIIK